MAPLGAPAYGIDLLGDDFFSTDTDTPGTLNIIGPAAGDYYAGDFLDGDFSILYTVDNATKILYSLDTTSGAFTAIGAMNPTTGHTWTGMAGDTTTGMMYAVSSDGSTSTLYIVDVTSGAVTAVGNTTGILIDIAVNAEGEMYAMEIINDVLVSVDKTTGAATTIGSLGFDANYAQGMDFDEEAGVLYLAAYNNTLSAAQLRIADTATGASTLVGPLGAGSGVEVDSFAIATSGAADVPWLSENPTEGDILADDSTDVELTFDATAVTQPGVYMATLRVISEDPMYRTQDIPVSMTVEPSETAGRVAGTVQSLGYCDNNPTPAEGAEVVINSGASSWTVYTNASGEYGLWLDESYSPVDITVTAPEHEMGMADGVTFTAQMTTTVDFDLRWLQPCVVVEQQAFDVSLGLGSEATYPLDIFNNGALGTDFTLNESTDVPWLSTDPITGTVAADSTVAADVIFDTTVLTQTGVYNVFLRVLTDDSMYPEIAVPITLTVGAPEAALMLDVTVSTENECGTAETLEVDPGTMVYFCYTVTNIGNVMLPNHTITDTYFGHIDTFVFELMPGMSESVIYTQTIDADMASTVMWMAENPDMGMDATAEDMVSVTLTTRYIYLPVVNKQ